MRTHSSLMLRLHANSFLVFFLSRVRSIRIAFEPDNFVSFSWALIGHLPILLLFIEDWRINVEWIATIIPSRRVSRV